VSAPNGDAAGEPEAMDGGARTYPMTVEQQSMWLDDHMGDGPSRYLESWVCHLRGAVDPEAVVAALEGIVRRHEALRSRFVRDEDQLLQVVLPEGPLREPEHRTCAAEALDAELVDLVRSPMDVAEGAMRAVLVHVAQDHLVVVLQLHHLVIDDWALQTLERDFQEHYHAHVENRAVRLPAPPLQPGPYALSQRTTRDDPSVLAYWRDNLRDIPADAGRSMAPSGTWASKTHRGGRISFRVDAAATKRIRAVCRQARATPFSVFAAAVGVLLHATTGAHDVVVGTPVSHRGTADRDAMVAPLSELLPLRLSAHPDRSFADFVAHVRTKAHEAMTYSEISYAQLVGLTRRRGEAATRELCRTVVVVDDARTSGIELPGVTARREYVFSGVSKFDLCLTVVAEDNGYLGFLEYAADLFSAETAERMATDFTTLLDLATGDAGLPLSRLGRRLALSGRD
jgi:hypothetical protein